MLTRRNGLRTILFNSSKHTDTRDQTMNKHQDFISQEDVSTKFDHIAACEYARRAAWQASADESDALAAYMAGNISDEEYCRAMENTEVACSYAISCGVSRRELPAH